MAYPTELTLATGTTVFAGDPESDEQIRSREVRVQITYELEDGECDVPLLAMVKAAELSRVHRAAWEQLRGQAEAEADADVETDAEAHDRAYGVDHAEAVHLDALDADDPQPPSASSRFAAPGAFPTFGTFPAPTPAPTQAGQTARQEDPKYNRPRGYQNSGSTGYPHAGNAGYPNGSPAPSSPAERQTEAQTETQIEWATRPQVLALQSHFKRLGVSSTDQTILLRRQFGKFSLERLTKVEAAGLMRSLERGELERGEFADESERGEWEPRGYSPGAAVH